MVLNTIINLYSLPTNIRFPDKNNLIGGFELNGEIYVVYQDSQNTGLTICKNTGEEFMHIPFAQSFKTRCSSNFIAYSDDVLWIGTQNQASEPRESGLIYNYYWFFKIDLKGKTFFFSTTLIPTDRIFPIGNSFWYYDNISTRTIHKWSDLMHIDRADIACSPYKRINPTTSFYPINYSGENHFLETNSLEPDVLYLTNTKLENAEKISLEWFFPDYEPLKHDCQENSNPIRMEITVNDNCLVLREWYELKETRHLIQVNGLEQIYCWDVTNRTQVHFKSRKLNNYVSRVLPIRKNNQVCLWSWEWYSGGHWLKVHDPVYNNESLLGKRKPDCEAIR